MLGAVLAEGLGCKGMLRMRKGVQLVCSEASLSNVWRVRFNQMLCTPALTCYGGAEFTPVCSSGAQT